MRIPCRTLGLTLLISGCLLPPLFAGKVEAYPNPKVDLSQYKTYEWLPPRILTKAGVDENHPAAPALKEVLGRQLAKIGLNQVAEGADLQIQTYVLTESIPQVEAIIFSAVAFDPGDVMTLGGPIATIGRYNKQGSLYINLIDRRTRKTAWFAMVTESLPNRTLKPDEIRDKLDRAAQSAFKKYPVKK